MGVSKTTTSKHFNSQPHEEADAATKLKDWVIGNFNSQPHEEADNEAVEIVKSGGIISTHSLTKRLTAILDKNTFI